MMRRSNARRGFSLVELSIVLVILGLLVGGILAGQGLIRAAQLRSLTTDIDRLQTAIFTFRDKYILLPGDFNKAAILWGETAPGDDCYTTDSTGTSTCNGNGDGMVYHVGNAALNREYFLLFKHLSNAGLIEGTYTGTPGPDHRNHQIGGRNVPQLRYPQAVMKMGYTSGYNSGTADFFSGYPGLNISFGANGPLDSVTALFRPEDVWNIDTKVDDGRPGTGIIVAPKHAYMPDCVSGTDAATAQYALTQSGNHCTFQRRQLTGRY